MDTFQTIISRRSIRHFKPGKISETEIEKLLTAAMQAPSARNTQSWQFVVITDKAIMIKIPQFHPYAEMLHEASVAIAVCGDQSLEQNVGYIIQNCSAATQNILLTAHDLGLGAVWLGIYPREPRMAGMKDLLQLPEYIVPVSLVALGHPDEKLETVVRFMPDRVHYDKW